MEERAIKQADLLAIETNLGIVHGKLNEINGTIQSLNSNVDRIDSDVREIDGKIGNLSREFHDFVVAQNRANRLGQAETRIVKIRQELEKKYGHYDIVRRTAIGILQATDLQVVRQNTISNTVENLMLSTPNYWLSPCLVALSAWINDEHELAERAIKESIKRDDEKASLFFALICRRAERKAACLKWIQRYLANQDEEKLDRKAIIILDAFTSGVLGADSEGLVSRQMSEWLERLMEKPGFVERQKKQWSDVICLKREEVDTSSYIYLKKCSRTWPILQDILSGASLHANILSYFTAIFAQSVSVESLKVQLDEILDSLISDFDDEELPLRKKEKLEQLIIDFNGDEDKAQKSLDAGQSAFETYKDFTQFLTDAAMRPEYSHVSPSAQKFAISLSRDWIKKAYMDVIAENRMKIPMEIEIIVDTFHGKTAKGENEQKLIKEFQLHMDIMEQKALSQYDNSESDKYYFGGGGVLTVISVILFLCDHGFIGSLALLVGIGMLMICYSEKKTSEKNSEKIVAEYKEKREKGSVIIRAVLAEVVDFRRIFEKKDAESQKVINFLEGLVPEQYIYRIPGTSRRIRT